MNENIKNTVMNIRTRNCEYPLAVVIDKLECREVYISDLVRYGEHWSFAQQKLYIESMLLGFPVSSFILVEDDDGLLKVVDGVKRIKALLGFFNDEFQVSTEFLRTSENISPESTYSNLSKSAQRHIENIIFHFFIHFFDDQEDALNFEKRLNADFEILARKIIVIDRYLSFDNDNYLEALTLISTFNSHLLAKYPDNKITVKIQQEGNKIRLIVENDDCVNIETEQILDEFNKGILRKLQDIEESKRVGAKGGVNSHPNIYVNIKNENQVNNNVNVNVDFKILLHKNCGLINELIEELESEPEIVNQLKKIISSSESISKPEQLKNSAFLSRIARFAEQVKEKGSTLYNLTETSKECADLIKKIIDNLSTFSNWL